MKKPVRVVFINVLVFAGVLVLVEGIAGYGLFVGRLSFRQQPAERRHTKYDPFLGWVNTPGIAIPDMYGPGIALTTNGQGFRNERDFEKHVPSGRIRVICSGDSYTLGYGVGDDQTWCHSLTEIDPRIEAVNMGQGGYGLDQAYLWYKRDGAVLDHHVHVFAFIDDDFGRMSAAEFWGYRKPVLKIVNGALVTEGVPVPGPEIGFLHRVLEYANQLSTVRLTQVFSRWVGLAGPAPPAHEGIAETRAVVAKVLDDLEQLNGAHESRLVLLMLPIPEELETGYEPLWTSFMREQAALRKIAFIDGFAAFRAVPTATLRDMFIQDGEMDYPGASGHLTRRGNALAAQIVYDALKDSLPSH